MRDDGGPAFPVQESDDYAPHSGMSLLDWFAGQWLTAAAIAYRDEPKMCAERAYDFADAMLAERKRRWAADEDDG